MSTPTTIIKPTDFAQRNHPEQTKCVERAPLDMKRRIIRHFWSDLSTLPFELRLLQRQDEREAGELTACHAEATVIEGQADKAAILVREARSTRSPGGSAITPAECAKIARYLNTLLPVTRHHTAHLKALIS